MRKYCVPLLMLMVGAVSAYGAESDFGWRQLGDNAPELNIDVIFGDPVKLSDGLGARVYVVEFWATWCGPCKFSIPHLSKLQDKYREDGLVIVGISDETEQLVRPYIENFGEPVTYSIAVDRVRTTVSRYMQGYGISGIPIAFVIDVNGRVVWHGHPSSEFLEKLIVRLLAEIPDEEDDTPTDSDDNAPEPEDAASAK